MIDVDTFICRRFLHHNLADELSDWTLHSQIWWFCSFCCLWVWAASAGEQSLVFHRNLLLVFFCYVFVIYDKWWFHVAWGRMWCIQNRTTQDERHRCLFFRRRVLSLVLQGQSYIYSVHINACSGFDALVSSRYTRVLWIIYWISMEACFRHSIKKIKR